MKCELTNKELEAIKIYKNEKFEEINQLLSEDVENDIALVSGNKKALYSKDSISENIEIIKNLYNIILKNNESCNDWTFYKGTSISEIDKLKNSNNIDKFILANETQQNSEKQLENLLNRPVQLQIMGTKNIPFVNIKEIDENDVSEEILIAPFTKIEEIYEVSENSSDINTSITPYNLVLSNQELEDYNSENHAELLEYILKNADLVNKKLNTCIELDNENLMHYENIRKLEQLLAKHNLTMEQENYDIDTTDAEKQVDLDDIARINSELASLKNMAAQIFDIRKSNIEFIIEWKQKIKQYLKETYIKIQHEEKIDISTDDVSNIANIETNNNFDIKTDTETNDFSEEKIIPEFTPTGNELIDNAKSEAQENIAMVQTLLNNIKNLIARQQNHARIAESLDSNYKALSNGFEMRNYAEELDVLVRGIFNKITNLTEDDTNELEKISKTSLQISTLLNYLNNAKSAVSKKLTRFDEINIIEENELKKEIAETIKNIRCEAELKKLRDDKEIIEEKSNIKKFFEKVTGKNKLNETMLDQIQVRQTAVRKSFKSKMPLAHNYSIHELIAEIEMFIRENDDDELVLEDVNQLRKIEESLKKNFVIIDSKVMSIINQKTGKNLPVSAKKVSKQELIEIDTYRFLNKYGYDKNIDDNEPQYQDTIVGEIQRIIDYIKSSNIL